MENTIQLLKVLCGEKKSGTKEYHNNNEPYVCFVVALSRLLSLFFSTKPYLEVLLVSSRKD